MRSLLPILALVIASVSTVRSQILSSESTPIAYLLKIDASDLLTSDTFSGSVLVNITVSSASTLPSSLVLHSEYLTLNESSLVVMGKLTYGSKWQPQAISNFTVSQTYLNVSFSAPLASGDYSLYIEYLGTYQNTMAGFAKVGYHFRNEQKYLGITGMEPTNARRVFPCYDTPAYKTQFTLEITVTRPSVAISNVRPFNVYNVSDTNKRVFVFNNYPAMPVYQLGWAVVDQTTYSVRGDNSTSPVIHTRAPFLYYNQTAWANELTWKLVQALNRYTDIPFNSTVALGHSKIEQVVLPEFFTGTSEGFSFMSFSEESILVSLDKSSTRYIQDVGLTLARGLVQQWFGDIISIDSWDNIWMMKGIDQFLQYNIAASLPDMSNWELEDQAVVELTQPALALDSPDSHPLTFHTDDETELVATVYDSLTKYKGGAIIRMVKDIFGSSFDNAMLTYITASRNNPQNPSNPSEFWNVLYGVAADQSIDLDKQSIADIMQQWTNVPGYPVLSVSKNSTHFNVSQSNSSQWWVPVTYYIQGSPNVNRAWLQPGSSFSVLASSAKWILLNVNQTGFYRVNYSASISQELANQLSTDLTQLPRLSRAQLIDDAFALDPQMALEFTSFLRAETDYFPWITALRHFQNLIYSMAGHSSYQLLQSYVLDLMNEVIAETGFSPKPQDTHIDKLKRALVLEKACEFGQQNCTQRAVTNLRTWMAQTYFDADLSPALMCAGVANSSTEVWHKLWSMYEYSIYPSIRLALLRSLTCTYNVELLYQFLNNITSTSDPVVSSKDKTILLQTLASKPFGAHVLLDWLVDRLQAQVNSTSPETSTPLPVSSTSPSSTTPITTTTSPDKKTDQPIEARLVANPPATRDTVVPTEKLPESVVTTILAVILPRLTSIEDGTKLDSFLTLGNKTGLSNATLETMTTATRKIYMQADQVMKINGKLTTWLEAEAATTTPSAGSTKPSTQTQQPPHTTPSPSGSPRISSEATTFLVCLLALCLHIHTMV